MQAGSAQITEGAQPPALLQDNMSVSPTILPRSQRSQTLVPEEEEEASGSCTAPSHSSPLASITRLCPLITVLPWSTEPHCGHPALPQQLGPACQSQLRHFQNFFPGGY